MFPILLRFRQHRFCMSADISEMFLRIRLAPEDRKFHRFICGDKDFEWLVAMFGNESSPNGSQKVLLQNCKDHGEAYPEATKTIQHSTYMDDSCDSRENESEIIELVQQLPALMKHANMSVGKIYSNSEKAMASVDQKLWAKQVVFDDKESIVYSTNKVLGMAYSGDHSDSLQYASTFTSLTEWSNKKSVTKVKFWTKRLVLQAAMSIYDPIGLISPFTVQARALLQWVWRLKTGWDDELDKEIVKKWEKWTAEVMDLKIIKIPRWIGFLSTAHNSLHTFVDASTEAYAAAVYLRCENQDETTVRLVTAKARVTPLKSETISRLELVACVIGVRIARTVNQVYNIPWENCQFWTDSQVSLHWITTPAKAFKAYVANRCGEIQSCTHQDQWHHVPTKLNPADIATRPISVKDLENSTLWWNGPNFLQESEENWPKTKLLRSTEKLPELKADAITLLSNKEPVIDICPAASVLDRFERWKPENWDVTKLFNGYQRCLKRWAYILNCCKRWRQKYPFQKPTNEDIENTRKFLIKEAQKEWYPELIKDGSLTKTVPSELKPLNIFLDQDGVLRSNSRLANIKHLTYNQKFPIILHRKSGFAMLIVKSYHVAYAHPVGHQALVNQISQEFFISGIGTLCHQVKANCYLCKRLKGKAATQLMSNLPSFRIEERCQPFLSTGLDFAGPFHVKMGRGIRRKKVWILVLTCLTIRAVHLEICYGQDTSCFLNALSRFCDIRGVPEKIVSDNQTAFVRADKDLQEWFQNIDFDYLAESTGHGYKGSKGIQWIFNPPLAPHFGGVFEVIVKCMKRGLTATLSNSDATEEEFRTAVSSVMSILNMRPITKQGQENDDVVLTPNHFLIGQLSGVVFPPRSDESKAFNLRDRYIFVVNLVDQFWRRFLKEMLQKLQPRRKWSLQQPNLTVDTIVIEIDPNLPRGQWRLLRVSEVLPSPDGLIRKVIVVNSNGKQYERAINRLIPVVLN